ncbi:MAG TPA: hypothetical protein VGA18_05475 [Rhodothermales bacterium]
MSKINYGRVIIGGLLAGVILTIGESILNLVVVQDQWQMFMEQRNLPAESTGINIMWLLWNFVIGLALVLLYALVRPRCGPGAKTAAWTGVFVWFLVWFMCFGAIGLSFGMPSSLILTTLIWGLPEVVLAALAGGWAYKEETA